MTEETPAPLPAARPKRRVRYAGTHPRRFEEKYKEHNPGRYTETVQKVLASGKTPAGTHRPIMAAEVLEILSPKPGQVAVDCTLGFGGHAEQLLARLQPGGKLLGLDADPLELPRAEARLRSLGFGAEQFTAHRTNFAGLPQILAAASLGGVDMILADLGVSSMQLDDPKRGFSAKFDGPLDLRLNPTRGQTASAFLAQITAANLEKLLTDNADEPRAAVLAPLLAGQVLATTKSLAGKIRAALPLLNRDDCDLTVRRVFQSLRIAVNDEFSALETFLRFLPSCLNPGGRVAILTFHSGEDRRVKKFFEADFRSGIYGEISHDVTRPSAEERRANPRSSSAKLRWAMKKAGP